MPQVVVFVAGQAAMGWAAAAGYGVVASALIGAGASYIVGEALGVYDTPGEMDQGAMVNKASSNAPIPVIYGTRKIGATRIYMEVNGDKNEYLHQVFVLAEGEIDSINNVYLNDVISTDSRFDDHVTIVKRFGTDNQGAVNSGEVSNLPSGWTTDHKLSGVAYIYVRLKWDKEIFSRGLPTITCDIDGKKVYDPRTSTATFNHNPALAIRDYLTNPRYGRSIPSSQIDDTAIIAAANYCDATVAKGGATSARYTCDGIVNITDKSMVILNNLLSSCRGMLVFTGGIYRLIIDKPESPVFTFSEDNITGAWSIALGNKKTTFNRVTAQFYNPDRNWQQDQAIVESADLRGQRDNNLLLEGQTTLPFTSNIYTAQQIATLNLNQSRQMVACEFTATIEALRVDVGDVVYIRHSTPGWDALNNSQGKLFRIVGLGLQDDDLVRVSAREYDATVYEFGTISTVDATPNTSLPDPSTVLPVSNLSVTPGSEEAPDGTVFSFLNIAWSAPDDAFVMHYDIEIESSTGDVRRVTTSATAYQYHIIDVASTYTVGVTAVNTLHVSSSATGSAVITPVADTVAPGVPTNTDVNGTFKKIILTWDNPTNSDLSHIEIKRSNDSQEANASVIGTTRASQWIDEPYTGNTTRYFWIRAVDTSGNASAWVSMGSGTSIRLDVGDFDDAVISPDFINQDFTTTLNAKATQTDLTTEVGRINDIVIEQQSFGDSLDKVVAEQQAVGNTFDTIAERMLTLATTQSDTLGTIANAGITVDPSTGAVSIQAVEALRTDTDNAISNVQVDLDAAEASINLKASTTYVNNAIASAVLDSADLASLNELEATVNQAEIDINSAEAAILLKADTTTVSGLDSRLGQAEIDINAAESAILLKASDTDLTAAENRITTAETTINALDIAAITNTVSDTRTLHNKLDTSAITNLAQLLDAYKSREIVTQEIAYARQEISADVRDSNVSIASAKLELAALIEDNAALITSEQTARAEADSAIAIDITNLTATVGGNAGAITSEQIARAAADSAMAVDITNLTATVDLNEGSINEILNLEVDEESALAQKITTLDGGVSENSGAITDVLNLDIDEESALAQKVTRAETFLDDKETTIDESIESVNGIKGQYTVTIDNNGHVSGFGLVSDIIDGEETSAFVIDADQFAIGSSGNYPFVYYANQTTVTKDGVDYDLEAGVYIKDAHIQIGAITDAHIVDGTITDAKIGNTIQSIDYSAGSAGWKIDKAGDIELNDAVFRGTLGAGVVKADNITIDDNITFNSDSSGLVFGKTSLGSTATGAFYGRAQNGDGEDIVGFHVSSPTSAMYADSDGNFALSNVKMFAGSAGSSTYFTGAGDYVTNISSLSTSLAIELIGGGAGACNNPASDRPSSWRRNGAAGGDSWIEFYDELDGGGDIVGTRITADGGVATSYEVGSNAEDYDGASGKNSSQTSSGGSGGGKQPDTSPPTGSYIPADGIRGGGGGGAGTEGRNGALSAGVTVQAENGKTASSIITVPSGAKSLKIHLGAGGTGGGKTGSLPSGFAAVNVGSVMTGWSYSSDGQTYYLTNGANGGDGFFEFSDPNTGGIEVDLVNLLNRVIALENA